MVTSSSPPGATMHGTVVHGEKTANRAVVAARFRQIVVRQTDDHGGDRQQRDRRLAERVSHLCPRSGFTVLVSGLF